jgi:hypothetical protein
LEFIVIHYYDSDYNLIGNFSQNVKKLDEISVVADRGYYRNLELKACEEVGITTYVPNSSTSLNKALGKFGRSVFRSIAAEDEHECPAGQRLAWRINSEEKGKWPDQCIENLFLPLKTDKPESSRCFLSLERFSQPFRAD